jgi:hypothetical protein
MILSVSTLIIGSGAATPVRVVNFCIFDSLPTDPLSPCGRGPG